MWLWPVLPGRSLSYVAIARAAWPQPELCGHRLSHKLQNLTEVKIFNLCDKKNGFMYKNKLLVVQHYNYRH